MNQVQEIRKKRSLIESGKSVLEAEIEGLVLLKDSLGDIFVQAAEAILNCEGQVIVTGMGKSGHIARKMAATFTSTGTRALFLHPAEASHGDLGMIQPQDLVIALSNSGETKELSDIIAYTHRHNVPLVAVTQKPKSTLAREATFVLLLPPVPEACPNKLAPTTSSTMMLALGDALSMTVLEQKGFSAKDFREFHPGGRLGQQLMRVKDIMGEKSDVPLVFDDDVMGHAILIMTQHRLGCVGIIDTARHLVGIITDGDLRRILQTHDNILPLMVRDVMHTNPKTIGPDILAADAVRIMKDCQITNLFVVDGCGHPVGVIHIHDCLKAGIF